MVAIPALTVVPPWQIDAISTAVTLHKAIGAFINVWFKRKTEKKKIHIQEIAICI